VPQLIPALAGFFQKQASHDVGVCFFIFSLLPFILSHREGVELVSLETQ